LAAEVIKTAEEVRQDKAIDVVTSFSSSNWTAS